MWLMVRREWLAFGSLYILQSRIYEDNGGPRGLTSKRQRNALHYFATLPLSVGCLCKRAGEDKERGEAARYYKPFLTIPREMDKGMHNHNTE